MNEEQLCEMALSFAKYAVCCEGCLVTDEDKELIKLIAEKYPNLKKEYATLYAEI